MSDQPGVTFHAAVFKILDATNIYTDDPLPEPEYFEGEDDARRWLAEPPLVPTQDGLRPVPGQTNHKQGWQGPIPIHALCQNVAGSYGGPWLSEVLPLSLVDDHPTMAVETMIEQGLGDEPSLEVSTFLAEDWNFEVVESWACNYRGLCVQAMPAILESLHKVESHYRQRLQKLPPEGVADFWRSWQIHWHTARVARNLWKADGKGVESWRAIGDARQVALLRVECYLKDHVLCASPIPFSRDLSMITGFGGIEAGDRRKGEIPSAELKPDRIGGTEGLAESEADVVFGAFQRIQSAHDGAAELLARKFRAPKTRVDHQTILEIAFSVWGIPPREVTAEIIDQVLHLLASQVAGGVELDPISCEAAGVDLMALAQEMRADLRRRGAIWTTASPIGATDRQSGTSDSSVHRSDAVDKPSPIPSHTPEVEQAIDLLKRCPGWDEALVKARAAVEASRSLAMTREDRVFCDLDSNAEAWLELVVDVDSREAFLTALRGFGDVAKVQLFGSPVIETISDAAKSLEQRLTDCLGHWKDAAHQRMISLKPTNSPPSSVANGTRTTRRDLVNAFIWKCDHDRQLKVTKTQIWRSAGHRTPRQFQYWQAEDPSATQQDDRNFRRILTMDPAEFATLLKKRGIA